MKLTCPVLAITLVAILSTPVLAATIPCEKALSDLRDAIKTAKLGDAGKAKIDDLVNKGIERCNADDDKRADDFFAGAMTLLGK